MDGGGRPEVGRGAVVVIPCLNERPHIAAVIARLLDDPGWSDPLVVVADGGSDDGGAELVSELAARDPRIRLAHNAKRLQSAGVNLGAALHGAGRRWLIRADAHADYPQGFVSSLIGEAERVEGAASVVVALRADGRGVFQRAAAFAQNSRLGAGGSAHRRAGEACFVDHGHHALFDLERFWAAGGYDETFTHNEDAELDVRLRRAGGRIWLTRQVEVLYFPRPSPLTLFRQYLSYGRGRARTLLRHREPPRVRQLLPLAVAPALAALAAAPAWPLAALPAGAWALGCCVYGLGIAARRRSGSAVLSGPAAMIMHAAWSIGFWSRLLEQGRARPTAPEREAVR
ncbi:MAG: glycosyltransferase family 2 protein [Caulobacteraceae bacterium]|nr:glycosyltransferase family 2 protein [Caulobacteraceae bacterium]